MSAHETPADMERARDLAVSDYESRTHEVRLIPNNQGPFRRHKATCARCGALTDWLTDAEDARKAGDAHVKSAAADVVAGVDYADV